MGDDRGILIKEATRQGEANNRSCYKNGEEEEEMRCQFEKNCFQIGSENAFVMNIIIIYLARIVERCLGWL